QWRARGARQRGVLPRQRRLAGTHQYLTSRAAALGETAGGRAHAAERAGDGALDGQDQPPDRALDRRIAWERQAPTEQQGIGEPNDQEGEYARKRHVGEEVAADRNTHAADRDPEGKRRSVSGGPQRRRRKRRRRQRPERSRAFAGNERAILV